jgi:hypothetical protein
MPQTAAPNVHSVRLFLQTLRRELHEAAERVEMLAEVE